VGVEEVAEEVRHNVGRAMDKVEPDRA
jgi:hypothetical protein